MDDLGALLNDPLFQLNFILWQTLPVPRSFVKRALFHEAGYRVNLISPKLPLPVAIRERLSVSTLDFQDSASPDEVLRQSNGKQYLLVECKRSSFGPDSTTAKQAVTLLLLNKEALSEALGFPAATDLDGLLTYVTNSEQIELMMDTLGKLRVLIEDSGFETIDSSCLGIRIDSTNSVYLVIDKSCAAKLGIDEKGDIKVIEGDIETDPRPPLSHTV